MTVNMVFEDWQEQGQSLHGWKEGIELSMGDFHAGSTFNVTIIMDNTDHEAELERAMDQGYTPVFSVHLVKPAKGGS